MAQLSTPLRKTLENTVIEARDIAEIGALAALETLGVHHHEPYPQMSPEQRKLRTHLRARARQLGDEQDKTGKIANAHLVRECAYEYWHRMLFARFLAENNLLYDPAMEAVISLEECEELAKEANIDKWEYASRCAQGALPQIFRPDDPLLQVTFAMEHRLKLEKMLDALEPEVFRASDSLGWVYQFWQSKKKKEVNESGRKIGADELPAVTQLFTEPYMVHFLIHNTLGAWYAGKKFQENPAIAVDAESEKQLREQLVLPDIEWEYLRFIKDEDTGTWRPAAGTFEGWPQKAAELKVLDPCCGSGHFLVAMLLHLVPVRMEEEHLSVIDAIDAVIRGNLHGLEIDVRCTQIAAFAVALAAWSYPDAGGFRKLPDIHIACSGIAPNAKKEEWLAIAKDAADRMVGETENTLFSDEKKDTLWHIQLKNGMEALYDLFQQAPVLGSLIDPNAVKGDFFTADYLQLADLLHEALSQEREGESDDVHEVAVSAKGIADAVKLLAGKYHLVITNVPYLKRGKQCSILKEYIALHHDFAKQDLATSFIERIYNFCLTKGSTSVVTPQNWFFLGSYKNLRQKLLVDFKWNLVGRLGPNSFETISGEVVNVALLTLSKDLSNEKTNIVGIDATSLKNPQEKDDNLKNSSKLLNINQKKQTNNPDSRIAFEEVQGDLLDKFGLAYIGQRTGDGPRFIIYHWEVALITKKWELFGTTVEETTQFSGNIQILLWENGSGQLADYQAELARTHYASGGWKQGWQAWGKPGVRVSQMSKLPVTIHCHPHFDNNSATIVPTNEKHLPAIWCFCSSAIYNESVRQIDQSLKVTNATLVKIPFDFEYWTRIAKEKYPFGLPEPFSNDSTQWLFHGHPCASVLWNEETKKLEISPLRTDDTVLHVAIARLLGYRWPAELDKEMNLSSESRQLVAKCDDLLPLADDDGIVCIPSVRGEETAVERLRAMLTKSYGSEWKPSIEHELLEACTGKATDLEDWLRNEFFEQHCKLFQHRPFIWHIWDGRKRDGFHALVNYHKLAEDDGKGRKMLENLTYSYLGDWITRQKDGVKTGEGGADERLIAAEELQKRLVAILNGESPFDIFVRWKPIDKQSIGWNPDINDGVRMNIRPFMEQDIPNGKKGAGILRWKPNIDWKKDRGNEPTRPIEEYPWFWNGNKFTGDRVNDVHLTLNEKNISRKGVNNG
jgi:hypothetical protein